MDFGAFTWLPVRECQDIPIRVQCDVFSLAIKREACNGRGGSFIPG